MVSKHKIEFIVFQSIGNIFTLLGLNSVKYSSKFIAFLFFYILRVRRSVVIENLTSAFPKLSNKEINKLSYENYKSIATTFLEIYILKKLSVEDIKQKFLDSGFDLIRKRFIENKGMILLTAHFGNWEMGAIASGIHLNENINVLVKKQKNPFVAKWLVEFRERFGNKEIYLGTSVRELYKTIKNKKIVGVVGDQRGRRDGVNVQFFGRETKTFAGTASIALKTKCPVFVLLCARTEAGTYKAIINEINVDNFTGNKEAQIQQFNQEYMSILEDAIVKHPEQWFWMHNIWKY